MKIIYVYHLLLLFLFYLPLPHVFSSHTQSVQLSALNISLISVELIPVSLSQINDNNDVMRKISYPSQALPVWGLFLKSLLLF